LSRDVVAGEVFKAFVSEYFILWHGDADRWLVPVQFKQLFRLSSLPSLIVLRPLSVYDVPEIADPCSGLPVEFPRDAAWCMLGTWDAASQGVDQEMILSFLAEHGDRSAEEVRLREEELRFQREFAEEARMLREQQDREVEESIQKDVERERQAKLEKEQAAVLEEERAVAAAEQEAKGKDLAAALEEEQAIAAAALEEEMAALSCARVANAAKFSDSPIHPNTTCKLVVRFPCGRRVERTFDADDKLSLVYEWADCCGELSGLQGAERFEVPHEFHLATTYPRQVLRDRSQSLRELQLLPNAMLAFCSGAPL